MNSMQKRHAIFLILLTFFGTLSCEKDVLYEKRYSFNDHSWGGGESPAFGFRANDTSSAYNFVLTLRTTTDYPYSNLWVFMYTQNPNKTVHKDTLNLPLAKPNGEWVGKNTGSIVENEYLIGFNKKFPAKGVYSVRFEQAVMEPNVDNVLDLSFKVSKVN